MGSIKTEFLSRSAFGALSLYEKNEYLQELTKSYMTAKGQEPISLSKEALSRLRRFYSRRSFADLKLQGIKDPIIARSLYRLADAVHMGTIEQFIESETPPGANKSLSRPPPLNDDQLMFFVPQLHDAPLKDDVNLMDVAPFSLSKTRRDDVLRYELKDCVITVAGGAENGLANADDYDIFLNMVSYLTEEMRIIKLRFSRMLPKGRLRASHEMRRERGLWQRRYWEHHIRNETDFVNHVRYCWINPVKHGLVERPQDWPYSSVHRDIREGRFEP